jgi:hypothetical protein
MGFLKFFILLFFTSSLYGQYYAPDQDDYGVSREVSSVTHSIYEFQTPAARDVVLNGLDTFSWTMVEKAEFNKAGNAIETQELDGGYKGGKKYFFTSDDILLETHGIGYDGNCYYKDFHKANRLGLIFCTKRMTCDNPPVTGGFFVAEYNDSMPMRMCTLDKDSLTVLEEESRIYDEETDILWITNKEGGERTARSAVKLKEGLILFYTTYLKDSSIYYTWNYFYDANNVLTEQQFISRFNSHMDTTRYIYVYDTLGIKKTAYQRNDSGIMVVAGITYIDNNDRVILEEEFDENNPDGVTRTLHEFTYDPYGNWIYEIIYVNDLATEVRWRKMTYF